MFLKNIRLTNFKCHESLAMDFSSGGEGNNPVRKTTFLVGENGTGKSALLQAVALITGGSEALRAIPGIPDDYIRQRKRFCTLEATITTAQGGERQLGLRFERGQSPAEAAAANQASLAPVDAALRDSGRSYFTAGYGSGRRLDTGGAAPRGDREPARYEAVRSLFSGDTTLRSPESRAAELFERGGNAAIHAFGAALNTFLPLEVRFKGLDKTGGQLLFSTPDGVLPFGALSNGYQQTVAWVSDLLYHVTRTFGDYKNPLAARGLLLIDEIDLHLHPAWQRQIYAFLTEGLPNFQVIATTYSPLTAQQAGRDELYAFRHNEAGRIDLAPFVGDPSRMLLHQLLMSPMFGLETDESLKVEAAKAKVRDAAISGKSPGPSKAAAKSAGAPAAEDLPLTVNTRSNSSAEPEDILLLQQINASLRAGKRGKAK
jgi:hypothetical protein